MSKKIQIGAVVEHAATGMKVLGALLIGINAPLSAFATLLAAGCGISFVTSLRAGAGHRAAVVVNGAFAVANALGIARAVGFLG